MLLICGEFVSHHLKPAIVAIYLSTCELEGRFSNRLNIQGTTTCSLDCFPSRSMLTLDLPSHRCCVIMWIKSRRETWATPSYLFSCGSPTTTTCFTNLATWPTNWQYSTPRQGSPCPLPCARQTEMRSSRRVSLGSRSGSLSNRHRRSPRQALRLEMNLVISRYRGRGTG